MRYVYLILILALILPATALTQANISGDYRIVFSTSLEKPVINEPTHMELHIQNMKTDGTAGKLEVKELIVHLQEHETDLPHMPEQNLSEIHRDIPHRKLLDMKENPNEPPGHYHANYTFNETGLYEVMIQFKGNGYNVSSSFFLEVKPEEREPIKTRYDLFGILAATVVVFAALVIAFRKIIESFDV